MNIYNLYFSPTGGTRKAADAVASGIGAGCTGIDLTDTSVAAREFCSDDICIFSVPSFSGRVPATALARMNSFKGNTAKAVLIAVYGNRAYEDTLIELKDHVESLGFTAVAAVAAIAEHSIAREIATGRPHAGDIDELKSFGEQIRAAILSDEHKLPAIPGNRPYKPLNPKGGAKPFADSSCVKCQKCAAGCPVGAIPMSAPDQTDSDLCISCMRCIAVCPAGARRLPEETSARISEMLNRVASDRKKNELFI